MSELQAETGAVEVDAAAVLRAEPRWPALVVFLTSWWLPATTARRTQHVSLPAAWLVHLLAVVTAPCLAGGLGCWLYGQNVNVATSELVGVIINAFNRYPVEATIVTAVTVGSIEGGFIGLALLLGPWGARDERLRDSIRNALRNTWLFTSAAIPWVLSATFVIVTLDQANRRRHQWQETPEDVQWQERLSAANTLTAAEQRKLFQQYHLYLLDRQRKWEAVQPWDVRHRDQVIIDTLIVAGAGSLWALLRAIGAPRTVPAVQRPPTCEACGYNLTLMPMEGRCPECGEAVIDSLGPQARPGTAWQRRRQIGRLRAWWETSIDAVLRPVKLGRQVPVSSRVLDHRLFLIGHAVILGVIGYFMPILAATMSGRDPFERRYELNEEAPAAAVGLLAAGLAVPLFVAGFAGLSLGMGARRNLLPAAMQVGAYLSPFLIVATLVSCSAMLTLVGMQEAGQLKRLEYRWGIDDDLIAAVSWVAVTTVPIIVYLVAFYRATSAARFANR